MGILTQEQIDRMWANSEAREKSKDFLMQRLAMNAQVEDLIRELTDNGEE